MFDFRSKKSRKLMNSITTSDEASAESVLFHMDRAANATSKTTVAVVSPLDYIPNQQAASIEKMDCGIF